MRWQDIIQVFLFLGVLFILVKPLGAYMARVYQGEKIWLKYPFGWLENRFYRFAGLHFSGKSLSEEKNEMTWKQYAKAMLFFHLLGFLVVYLLQRLQGHLQGSLFLNPDHQGNVPKVLAMNTAISFITNTNWQAYGGETTLSYLTQMLGLTVQNFVSAATGMAIAIALIRGFSRRTSKTIGNFWVDLVRGTLYILLPLSLIFTVILMSQGVVQTFSGAVPVSWVDSGSITAHPHMTEQTIALGPVASQISIKQLGTNGGGFFNANSAHPFENPTPFSNFLEMLALLLIPAALCYTFGKMVKNTKQGWAILAAMTVVFVGLFAATWFAEQKGNPLLSSLGVDQIASNVQAGGNMEGKEVRFGIVNSALWATATTAASNGAVNAMHDSFTPLGSLFPMWLMQLGEVIFGGVGSGLYGMLMFAVIAVFVAGLMVGRTPEYLEKKVEAFDIKMASLVILFPAAAVLLCTAIAVVSSQGVASLGNQGPHGFSEILYAFSSTANNNGSALGGLNANTTFYHFLTALCMLIGRFCVAIPILAFAGNLAQKKAVPPGPGTLQTHTPLFIGLLIGVVILVGALTFLPALALGPLVEHLSLHPFVRL